LFPFPSEVVADAAAGARAVAVYENSMGQMIDDVRLAVLGRTPVHFIGGLTMDSSGFGIGPDIDVAVIRARIQGVLDSVPDETPGSAGTTRSTGDILSGGRRS
jgi:2-oxoglutarate ferredoxin oxidoreductase subunit alpha